MIAVAWERPVEAAERQSWRRELSFDHWFLRFRWAAGLHSRAADDDGDAVKFWLCERVW